MIWKKPINNWQVLAHIREARIINWINIYNLSLRKSVTLMNLFI